jgi:hypothetical protein
MQDDESRDLLSDRRFEIAIYWLPAAALIASGSLHIGQAWRTVIWTVALTIMGVGCLANAVRCGRVHCYFTGPFFLAMAAIALLYGLGVLSIGHHGWGIIGLAVLIGAVLLCWLPEAALGRYRERN